MCRRSRCGIVGGVAHEDGDAVIEQPPLQRFDDRESETAETVGRQDADRHRPGAMQALGEIVRAIVERLGGVSTLARVSALSRPLAFIALEAVPIDTPASRATSRRVARGRGAPPAAVVGRQVVHLTAPESRPEM